MDLFEGLLAAGEFCDDGIDSCGPDEWFGVVVPSIQEFFDGGDQIQDAEERVAARTLIGQLGEPTFNQVKPTATGWDIVDDKTAMFAEPGFHIGMPMSTIVIHDQMQDLCVRKFAVNASEKLGSR